MFISVTRCCARTSGKLRALAAAAPASFALPECDRSSRLPGLE